MKLIALHNKMPMYNRQQLDRGVVPIGRTAGSKTDGWGFESLRPCQSFEDLLCRS